MRIRCRFDKSLLTAAALLALGGCASTRDGDAKPWKIEPVYGVQHALASSDAYYRLGRYHDGSQEWAKAVDAYRKAIAVDAGNVEAYNALGVALARTGRLAEAEITLRQAVALDPARAHVLNNLGYVLLLAGKPADAVVVLEAAVAQDATNRSADANLQVALARARSAPAARPAPGPARDDVVVSTAAREDAVPVSTGAAIVPAGPAAVPPPVPAASPDIEIRNGNGVAGMASRLGRFLAGRGCPAARLTNLPSYTQAATVIVYSAGHEQAARRLAHAMPGDATLRPATDPGMRAPLVVVLGRDWARSATCVAITGCRTPVATDTAVASR
jgi:tetratricopeptide (TPR) repeat protein